MPKKSKRSKIIADYRRKLSAVTAQQPVVDRTDSTTQTKNVLQQYTLPVSHPIQSFTEPAKNTDMYRRIRKDLAATLILVTITLAAEIAVWKLVG